MNTQSDWDTMEPHLRIEEVSRQVSPRFTLWNVNLELLAGEFLVFFGPSGCGKTTLLRIIAGLDAPDTGCIELGGQVANDPKIRLAPQRREIGMVFQNLALWPHFTVEKHLRFVLKGMSLGRSETDSRIAEILELVGLAGHEKALPHQLSGGEGQRLALARALVTRPGLLLLDEPLSGVDEALRERLCGEIRALQRRVDVPTIYVTHHREETLSTADRVAVFRDGEIVQMGTPREIYQAPASPFVARLIGTRNLVDGRVEAGGMRAATALGDVLIRRPSGGGPGPLEGEKVTLALSPSSLGLVPDGGRTARLTGVSFRGDRYLLTVSVGEVELSLFAGADEAAGVPQIGGTVRVQVKGPGAIVLEDGAADTVVAAENSQ